MALKGAMIKINFFLLSFVQPKIEYQKRLYQVFEISYCFLLVNRAIVGSCHLRLFVSRARNGMVLYTAGVSIPVNV